MQPRGKRRLARFRSISSVVRIIWDPTASGRYLVSVNSGFGIQFNAAGNRGQQSLSLIDLNAKPAPWSCKISTSLRPKA
jgi:hypothetical protein